jgi:uncharacterized protein YegP (UPF0339 family)
MEDTENLKGAHYYIQTNEHGHWYWYLLSGDGRRIAQSGSTYNNPEDCKKDIEFVKATADTPIQTV